MNWWVPIFVIVPLGGAFLSAIIGSFSKAFGRYFTSLLLALLTGFALYIMFTPVGTIIYKVGGHELFNNIPIAIYMVLDGLSIYLLVIINLIGFLSAFYSISYIKSFTSENYYYTLFFLMVAGMNGVVLSGDIFNLYVFLEFGIGAYAAAILTAKGIPGLLSIPIAGMIAGVVGIFIGLPALRLSGLYLAIATMGLGFIVEEILVRWESLTNGNAGMVVNPLSTTEHIIHVS